MTGERYFFVDAAGRPIEPSALPFDSLCLANGVFETALFLEGRGALWPRHEKRLAASCEALSIASRGEAAAIMQAAARLVSAESPARARVRVTVFAGADDSGPAGVVKIAEAAAAPEGVTLLVSPLVRYAKDALAPHKTVGYLFNSLVRQRARAEGAYDAVVVDSDGNVAETSAANIFLCADGRIVTPAEGCILPGIVRGWLLESARGMSIKVEEARVSAEALSRCEAAFITNSIIGLVPVASIAGRALADVARFEWFTRLAEAYKRATGEAR